MTSFANSDGAVRFSSLGSNKVTSPALPGATNICNEDLTATLRDVTTSYNFSRLLAILDHMREGGAAMVARDEGMRG